jgi:hemolysin III
VSGLGGSAPGGDEARIFDNVSEHARTGLPLYTLGEELAHAITHGVGLVLSIGGLAALVVTASLRGNAWHVVSCAVFGATLVALYATSTLYHGVRTGRAKRVLQQMDHAAIFLLIAGSYTPFALVSLRGGIGWTLLAVIWGLALFGIALQIAVPSRARRVAVLLHLTMGWLVVVAFEPLMRAVEVGGVVLLLLGGIAYTAGLIFYAWKRLPYNHAVWHVFVLAGSVCHFACVLGYVIPPAP